MTHSCVCRVSETVRQPGFFVPEVTFVPVCREVYGRVESAQGRYDSAASALITAVELEERALLAPLLDLVPWAL